MKSFRPHFYLAGIVTVFLLSVICTYAIVGSAQQQTPEQVSPVTTNQDQFQASERLAWETASQSAASESATGSASASAAPEAKYTFKQGLATVFWVGETASIDNGQIANLMSAWDHRWQEHFGGVDDPDDRCGFQPCSFEPLENPFYVALPYNDLTVDGQRKASAADVPWFDEYQDNKSLLKNRWVEVVFADKRCYGQWQDVGPFESDDFAYVFGSATEQKNKQGVQAAIDLSPALRDCLAMTTNEVVAWRFVEDHQVPKGPWLKTVTITPVRW